MNDRVSRLTVVPAACGFALAVWLCRPAVVAQEKKPAPVRAPLTPVYFGTTTCGGAGCHGEAGPRLDGKEPRNCRYHELTAWEMHDKHADAYRVLQRGRGAEMLKALKIDLADKEQAKACVSCHGMVPADGVKTVRFDVAEGVSCGACHGNYEEWVEKHVSPLGKQEFRALPPQVKEGRYGLTDLGDPLRRARLCASCHVGSAAEGKVVTHKMYAAGHPPLPGFEAASFCDMMPPHWPARPGKGGPPQAKLVLVGAAVSLAEYMRLVEEEAAKKKDLDWALFDCYSCHHELKSPAWRQSRGYPGKPGRVPAKTWPAELVRLALAHLGDDPAEFEKLWGEAQAAFVARQFGDVPRVGRAAAALAAWADRLAARLNEAPLDEAATSRLLARLPALSTAPDYDSARQLGWAYRALWDERSPRKEPPEALKQLIAGLGLDFPTGRMRPTDGDGVIVRELGPSLRRLNDYDPGKFLRLWRGLPVGEPRSK